MSPPEVKPSVLFSGRGPLGQQFRPVSLGFQECYHSFVPIRDHYEFCGKRRETTTLAGVIHSLGEASVLLRRHLCGGKDMLSGVDQEEDEDLAVTSGLVGYSKRNG